MAGGIIDANALARELSGRGLIVERKGRHFTVEWVRGVGRATAYALSRSHFGRSFGHGDE